MTGPLGAGGEPRGARGRPRVTQEIRRLRPWYHDFSPLGLETRFESRLPQPARAIVGLCRELARRIEEAQGN